MNGSSYERAVAGSIETNPGPLLVLEVEGQIEIVWPGNQPKVN